MWLEFATSMPAYDVLTRLMNSVTWLEPGKYVLQPTGVASYTFEADTPVWVANARDQDLLQAAGAAAPDPVPADPTPETTAAKHFPIRPRRVVALTQAQYDARLANDRVSGKTQYLIVEEGCPA